MSKSDRTAQAGSAGGEPAGFPGAGRKTILLAEDDVAVRRVATTILEKHGYSVLGVGDGTQVLTVFESTREEVALVILDLRMPGPSAEETLTALLKLEPAARVLLMSGHIEPEVPAEIRRRLHGFLGKPFRGGELLRAVEAALADA
jgi:DNA-binding NtrC family response regulator